MLLNYIHEQLCNRKVYKVESHMKKCPWVYFNIDKSGHRSITHIYSTNRVSSLQINFLEKNLAIKFYHFDTDQITGVYFEIDQQSFLIFEPKNATLSNKNLFFEQINQSVDSLLSIGLKQFAKHNNLSRLASLNLNSFGAIIGAYHESLSIAFCETLDEINKIKIVNTHNTLYENYCEMLNLKSIESDTHVGHFSTIYFTELKAIELIFENKKGISLHDAATNTGHFPSLIDTLNANPATRTPIGKIYCSDIFTDLANHTFMKLHEKKCIDKKNISLIEADLISGDLSSVEGDIITVNDVLEHFDDSISKMIFHRLWEATKKLLIIHVPFEDTAHAEYGHLTTFYKAKLCAWASELKYCENITQHIEEKLMEKYNINNLDQYLFLVKKIN